VLQKIDFGSLFFGKLTVLKPGNPAAQTQLVITVAVGEIWLPCMLHLTFFSANAGATRSILLKYIDSAAAVLMSVRDYNGQAINQTQNWTFANGQNRWNTVSSERSVPLPRFGFLAAGSTIETAFSLTDVNDQISNPALTYLAWREG